jgi:hypothetical protein
MSAYGCASKFLTLLSTTMSELDADLYGGEPIFYVAYSDTLLTKGVYRPLWERRN